MELKVTGLQELQLDLKDFENRVKDTKRFFDIVGAKWVTDIQNSFKKSQDPYGNKWASVNYTKYRNGVGYERNVNPLQDTGRLVGSINYNSSVNGLNVGSPMIYAKTHNEGLNKVIQRQFIPEVSDPNFDNSNLGKSLDNIIKDYYLGVFDE